MSEDWLIAQMSNATLSLLGEEDDGVAVVWAKYGTWNPRKSVVVERRHRVLLDYVFLRPYDLSRIQSELELQDRHVHPMRTSTGTLIRVPSEVVDELMVRAEAGEFDQMPSRCRSRRTDREQRSVDLREGAEVELSTTAMGVLRGVVVRSGRQVVLETSSLLGRVTVRAESIESVLVS